MNKRPLSVTIIGCAYLALGLPGFAYHLSGFTMRHWVPGDLIWIELVFLLAFMSGLYVLRGHNWARWLALAWMVFHVIISVFHNLPELAIHSLLCAVLAYFLFKPTAARYFRAARVSAK